MSSQPTPTSTPRPPDPTDAPEPQGPTVRLWPPRDIAIVSFFLGFPGGLAVTARNLHRLGQRGFAWLHVLAVPTLMLAILLLPETPRGAALVMNIGVAAYLYLVLRSKIGAFERAGGRVEPASGGSGLATFLGGWAIALVPLVLVLFLGFQAQSVLQAARSGTVEFGTGGLGCSIELRASTMAADEPIHYVAYLSREVAAGETVTLRVSEELAGPIGSDALVIDSTADCVAGTLPADILLPGTYTFEFSAGAEELASGKLLVSDP